MVHEECVHHNAYLKYASPLTKFIITKNYRNNEHL